MFHRVCEVCGRAFDTDSNRRTACSDACSRKRVAERHRNAARARRAVLVAAAGVRVCAVCGGPVASRRLGTVFCSTSCYHRAYLRQKHGLDIRDASNMLTCAHCGKVFRPVAARQRFCSSACRIAAERNRQDASIEAGKLTAAQAEQVREDMQLEPSERYAASKSWTRAMHDYARRLYEQETRGMP